MPAYNFKKQFAPAVEAGTKRCTIRARRKRPTRVGESLQLYTGMRTKACRLLGKPECIEVTPFEINEHGVPFLEGRPLTRDELHALARADGFTGAHQFLEFFKQTYGLPLLGAELIRW